MKDNYYQEQLQDLPEIDRFGAHIVVHVDGKSTNYLKINPDSIKAFQEFCINRELDK